MREYAARFGIRDIDIIDIPELGDWIKRHRNELYRCDLSFRWFLEKPPVEE